MCDTVVFATDLSPASDRVVACLHGLRQLGTERLLLTHALGIRHLDDLKHQLGPLAEHKLNEQKAVLEKQRFTVEVVIAPGVPSWEINSVARDRHASMIVIAPRGVPAAREALLGRVAFGVAHRAEVPVLMAQLKITEDENRCEAISGDLLLHVLFPTDFSEVAERAYAYLEDLVRTGCRRVSLMHVQDWSRIHGDLGRKLEEFNIDRQRLERLERNLTDLGATEVRIALPSGLPRQEIVDDAEKGDYSLIVMASHGRGFFGEAFLGSAAHHVVRRTLVPTLLIPPLR